ncbi:MAG: hypothetical protein EHM68_18330 [Lysobacterales bacterium]|nr:MAG: hypothetical protein EHM68_18330 [Xanthomonadales bacterium]
MPRRSTELLQEFIVIVIGVFVALAAESWWSEREDRRIEREIREDMVAEFEANIRILEADLAANEGARPRMAILEGLSSEALMALTDEQMTGIFSPPFDWSGFDPAMGTVQALVESGNLAVVSDREMRLGLARWTGLLENPPLQPPGGPVPAAGSDALIRPGSGGRTVVGQRTTRAADTSQSVPDTFRHHGG